MNLHDQTLQDRQLQITLLKGSGYKQDAHIWRRRCYVAWLAALTLLIALLVMTANWPR